MKSSNTKDYPTVHEIRKSSRLVTVVIPTFNEEYVLPELHRRLAATLDPTPYQVEMLFVNDSSTDGTLSTLMELRNSDPRISILDLSRNFGKEIAMTAGLEHAQGDAVIVIDADLQDPPELIPDMLKYWEEGYDAVYATRTQRKGESALKRLTAHLFYRVIKHVSNISIPEDTGDYRLLSRRAVNAVTKMREQHRFMKGLFAWIGYPQKAIPYSRDPRFGGETKWNYWKLWNFALEGITSFTTMPLKIATYVGMLVAFGALVLGLFTVLDALIYGNPVKGYPSLMAVILFLGGIQLMFIGIIGEYVGRMFDETKNRPLYFVQSHHSSEAHIHSQIGNASVSSPDDSKT